MTVSGPESLLVPGDPERLHQVVTSLLANVRVHTPPGTQANVTVGRHNGLVELVVSDDGPGMPPAALAHVFDRFYRADPSRSRRSGGSGLGLSIVDAIVTAHGGTVSADSKPGAGTSITVKLPSENGRRQTAANPNSVPPEGEGPRCGAAGRGSPQLPTVLEPRPSHLGSEPFPPPLTPPASRTPPAGGENLFANSPSAIPIRPPAGGRAPLRSSG